MDGIVPYCELCFCDDFPAVYGCPCDCHPKEGV